MEAFLSQAWREKRLVLLMVEGVPGTKRRTPRRIGNMVGPGDIALAVTSMACVSNITHGRFELQRLFRSVSKRRARRVPHGIEAGPRNSDATGSITSPGREIKEAESGQVTARPRQARNEAASDWGCFLPVIAKTSSAASTAAPSSNG